MEQVIRADGSVIGFGICYTADDLKKEDIFNTHALATKAIDDDCDELYGEADIEPIIWNGKDLKSVQLVSWAEIDPEFTMLSNQQQEKLKRIGYREIGIVSINRKHQSLRFVFNGNSIELYIRASSPIDNAVHNAKCREHGSHESVVACVSELSLAKAFLDEIVCMPEQNSAAVVIVQGCTRMVLPVIAMKTESLHY